jgi:hypothetical protein
MPTNRIPLKRDRLGFLSPESLALFAKLDGMEDRDSEEFRQRSHDLARLLGLVAEWWTINSVLDRSDGPHHPASYLAHADWHRCREVRTALLQALQARSVT